MDVLDNVSQVLRRFNFRFANESQLQAGIAVALHRSGVAFVREVAISDKDRPDFMASGVAIEVKIKGGLSAVTRQVHRYAQRPDVESVLLVTTCIEHRGIAAEMCGKPVRVVCLLGSTL